LNEQIKVCASQPPAYDAVINWLRNGEVWWQDLRSETEYYLGQAYALEDFNRYLDEYGFAPVGNGRGSKRSKLENALLPF
jgi:hypothetical protein